MNSLKAILAWLRRYVDNPDPLAKAAGTVAMVVASNLPFYPLYLHYIVGYAAWPAWISLPMTALFAAVPAVARRHSLAGRVLLPIAGVANTVLCVKLLGVHTAVELFLFPCILLGGILFRPSERIVTLPVLALPFVAYLFIDGALGAPVAIFPNDSYSSLIALNAMSVASLTALMGIVFAGVMSERKI